MDRPTILVLTALFILSMIGFKYHSSWAFIPLGAFLSISAAIILDWVEQDDPYELEYSDLS